MEPELSVDSKLAIRNYMLKMLTLPGVVALTLSFILGFFINDFAKTKAYQTAYKESVSLNAKNYTDSMKDITKTIGNVTKEATKATSEAEALAKKLSELTKEAIVIKNQLKTTEAVQNSEKMVQNVVESLVGRKDFMSDLLVESNQKLKTIKDEVQNNLKLANMKFEERLKEIEKYYNERLEKVNKKITLFEKRQKLMNLYKFSASVTIYHLDKDDRAKEISEALNEWGFIYKGVKSPIDVWCNL